MPHDPYVLAAIAGLVLLALYRRFRRLFGRQLLRPARAKVRIALLGAVALVFALRSLHSVELMTGGACGFAAGIALAWIGVRLTRFDVMPKGVFYTPNGYLGAGLAAILLGRLVYRFQVLYPALHEAQARAASPFAADAFQRSPLTLALFGIVIGYYLAYYVGLLIRHGELAAPGPVDHADRAPSPPSGP